jgi:hypothetical protein
LRRSHHDRAAGDVKDNARDPRRIIGSEIQSGQRDIVRRAKAPDGMQVAQRSLLRLGDTFFVAFGEDRFRGDAVGPNAVWADLRGEILGENFDAGFRRGVSDGRARMRPAGGCRRNGDDVSGPSAPSCPAECF